MKNLLNAAFIVMTLVLISCGKKNTTGKPHDYKPFYNQLQVGTTQENAPVTFIQVGNIHENRIYRDSASYYSEMPGILVLALRTEFDRGNCGTTRGADFNVTYTFSKGRGNSTQTQVQPTRENGHYNFRMKAGEILIVNIELVPFTDCEDVELPISAYFFRN